MISRQRRTAFQQKVYTYYNQNGRHDLPWRTLPCSLSISDRAYRVLVSEMMLQQTQVPRVIEKYRIFLNHFPSVRALARAPLGEVLTLWQGLGYNRRAQYLHECAHAVSERWSGRFPHTVAELQTLKGVGHYTASAVAAFAYNQPVVMIETNIRSVYLHHFLQGKKEVEDKTLLPLIGETVDTTSPREWYWALMDYGSYIKHTYGNPNKQSAHYTKQSAFKGSDRQIRGAILAALTTEPMSVRTLGTVLRPNSAERITTQLHALTAEGLIERHKARYRLPH